MDITIIRESVTRRKLNDMANQQFCDMGGAPHTTTI